MNEISFMFPTKDKVNCYLTQFFVYLWSGIFLPGTFSGAVLGFDGVAKVMLACSALFGEHLK